MWAIPDLFGQVTHASRNLGKCAKGEIAWEGGVSVKYVILWGELTLLEIIAPDTETLAALEETELVQNLRKGIPPNG